MFSAVMSAFFSISLTISRPFGDFRLIAIDFLLTLNWRKYQGSSSGLPGRRRRPGSPRPGFSILTTSAPNQASTSVQVVPASNWVKSTTLTPLRKLRSVVLPAMTVSSEFAGDSVPVIARRRNWAWRPTGRGAATGRGAQPGVSLRGDLPDRGQDAVDKEQIPALVLPFLLASGRGHAGLNRVGAAGERDAAGRHPEFQPALTGFGLGRRGSRIAGQRRVRGGAGESGGAGNGEGEAKAHRPERCTPFVNEGLSPSAPLVVRLRRRVAFRVVLGHHDKPVLAAEIEPRAADQAHRAGRLDIGHRAVGQHRLPDRGREVAQHQHPGFARMAAHLGDDTVRGARLQ